ncbi:MAG: hypothetical protein RJA36_2634 [Pseudomonadota bacterium]|jgi:molybdate transport repressor ModE-like protein
MPKVSISPQWTISDAAGRNLSPRLLELLREVQEHGSLAAACKATGASYRHAWNLIRDGETQIGQPLLNMARGKNSTLTALGEKLVWAGRRISARLTPMLETLSSELESELGQVMHTQRTALRVHASHGFAIEKLIETLVGAGHDVERKYVGSQEAVASMHAGQCELAGFHVPMGEFERRALSHYLRWLDMRHSRLIHVATRRQGLMVARGNPLKIYDIKDLARPDVRFVNRQPSSGTRFLLEALLDQAGLRTEAIAIDHHSEFTHAAVAAYIASGMADAGLGVETPSRRFQLDFIPLANERYFLLTNESCLQTPVLQAVLSTMRSQEFRSAIDALPGYSAKNCGEIQTIQQAFAGSGAACPALAGPDSGSA